MSISSIVTSLGHHGFWGYSSGFDVLDALMNSSAATGLEDTSPIVVLLVYPGDIRHIIRTVSARRRHLNREGKLRPLHFYILEAPVEVLAREILLTDVITDVEVPVRQRGTIFLEIFGNCKLQERTSRYVESVGQKLRKLVTDPTKCYGTESAWDLSRMKYRVRDELEEVFKSYSRGCLFDVDQLRDQRLRGYYTDRYDSRVSLSDWDWHMTIKPNASIIHVKQYKDWRYKGIAYEFGDQVYVEPNRTLMSYVEGTLKRGKDAGIKKEVIDKESDARRSSVDPVGQIFESLFDDRLTEFT